MGCHQGCGLGAQPVIAQTHKFEVGILRGAYLFRGKVALRPDQYAIRPAGYGLAQQVVCSAHGGNEALFFPDCAENVCERCGRPDLRQGSAHGLLHRADRDLYQPVRFDDSPFSMRADWEADPVNANFNCFLHKPLRPVRVPGGRYGDMVAMILLWRAAFTPDFELTFPTVAGRDYRFIKTAMPVCDIQRIADFMSQDPYTMS